MGELLEKMGMLVIRLLILLIMICNFSILFCRGSSYNPIATKINKFAKKHCMEDYPCKIPEEIYFTDNMYDNIIIMDRIYSVDTVRDIIGEGVKLENGVVGYRMWFLMKGNEFYKTYKDEYVPSDLYGLEIKWESQINPDKDELIYKIEKKKHLLYVETFSGRGEQTELLQIFTIE